MSEGRFLRVSVPSRDAASLGWFASEINEDLSEAEKPSAKSLVSKTTPRGNGRFHSTHSGGDAERRQTAALQGAGHRRPSRQPGGRTFLGPDTSGVVIGYPSRASPPTG